MEISNSDLEFSHWKQKPVFPYLAEKKKESLHRAEQFVENILKNEFDQPLYNHQREAVLRYIYEGEVRGIWSSLLWIVTGGGKTRIMAVLVAYFWQVYGVQKFLILTPNTIVRERVKDDFEIRSGEYVYNALPGLFFGAYAHDPEKISCKVLRNRSDVTSIKDANIIVANIHQVYEGKEALESLLIDTITPDLVIFNDEAHNAAAEQYREVLKLLQRKTRARVDLTATPHRLDRQDLDTKVIYQYDIQEATRDRVVKHVLVTKPDIEKVKLTYEEWDDENQLIRTLAPEEMDWDRIEKELQKAGSVKFVTAEGALRQQLKIAMACFEYQNKGVYRDHEGKKEYEPLMMIVALSHNDARRIHGMLLGRSFKYKEDEVLLVHSKQSEFDNKKAFLMGRKSPEGLSLEEKKLWHEVQKVRVVIAVSMLREGWDVRNISTICLFRKFSKVMKGDTVHSVYGQQIIGRGLRKIHYGPAIDYLFVVDHPAFAHDWLWEMMGSQAYSKPLNPGEAIDDTLISEITKQNEINEAALEEQENQEKPTLDLEDILASLPDIPDVKPIYDWQEHFQSLSLDRRVSHAQQFITNVKTQKLGSNNTAHELPEEEINLESINESVATTDLSLEQKCEQILRDLDGLPERALQSTFQSCRLEDLSKTIKALEWVLQTLFHINGLGGISSANSSEIDKLHFSLPVLFEEFMKAEIIMGITERDK